MANEIVKMVAKKANISEQVAQVAVDTVLNLLKDKLPPAVSGTLDSLLHDSSSAKATNIENSSNPLGDVGNIVGALGGLFGKK